MADHDVPEDLVALKRAFWAADARCSVLADRPAAEDPAEQEAQDGGLAAARTERSRIVEDLYAHPWWATAPTRYEADQKVVAAAKALEG